ncbi:MAG: transglycosylase SLT domain-containing protein [Deltaproteobacteria bacterium]|nr:transglycosylase SLT domain-containing protein [Deltaproteobacteria bacterium]
MRPLAASGHTAALKTAIAAFAAFAAFGLGAGPASANTGETGISPALLWGNNASNIERACALLEAIATAKPCDACRARTPQNFSRALASMDYPREVEKNSEALGIKLNCEGCHGQDGSLKPAVDAETDTPDAAEITDIGDEASVDAEVAGEYAEPLEEIPAVVTPAESDKNTATAAAPQSDSEAQEAATNFVPVLSNAKVDAFKRYFQTRGKDIFSKWLDRSKAYMPMVLDILEKEGLPEDIAYLALIESGYNPHAKSRAGAVGIWQFMPGTARKYGLRVDWWIDERKDPEKATKAAADYLNDLYDRFDSWYLAAAGYNAGEGRIERALRRFKADNYWDIASNKRALKRETREYVPKYLAAIIIAKEPECYGFMPTNTESDYVYDTVEIRHSTDINVIAKAAGTTATELKRLNPELNRWFTPPDYKNYKIKLPVGTKAAFLENIQKVPEPERLRFHMHKVKRGETLSTIARKYGTSVQPILYLNNIKNVRSLKNGTMIAVPVRAVGRAEAQTDPALKVTPKKTTIAKTGRK